MELFELNDAEKLDAKCWMEEQINSYPTIQTTFGGRFSYVFTPTSIGIVIQITDNQENKTKEITDISSW